MLIEESVFKRRLILKKLQEECEKIGGLMDGWMEWRVASPG
jgi:hypothetical protein